MINKTLMELHLLEFFNYLYSFMSYSHFCEQTFIDIIQLFITFSSFEKIILADKNGYNFSTD